MTKEAKVISILQGIKNKAVQKAIEEQEEIINFYSDQAQEIIEQDSKMAPKIKEEMQTIQTEINEVYKGKR